METDQNESVKNMISMKTVILTVIFTTVTAATAYLLHQVDQRRIPFTVIITLTIFTAYLVKFSLNSQIQAFLARKLTQKKTILTKIF